MDSKSDNITILYSTISERNHLKIVDFFSPLFGEDFQQRIHNYNSWQDTQATLVGRILLKRGMEILNFNEDVSKLKTTKYGKPFFKNSLVGFSISHSGEIVICALVKKGEIGIDIEYKSQVDWNFAKQAATENEWVNITASVDPVSTFYSYWTKKEAAIKAMGKELLPMLKSIKIENDIANIGRRKLYLNEVKINPAYICHTASPQKDTSSRIYEINPLL